jgi:nitrite reductase/ring-hydroxylating ferredoxin subunit
MNRREFIRTVIASTTLIVVGAAGIFEIAAKAEASKAGAQQTQQLQLPPISTETSQSSTTQLSQAVQSATAQTQSSALATQTSTTSARTSTTSSQSSAAAAPSGYVLVAELSSLSGKTSAYFTHPSHGSSILLSLDGQWRAFSAICTHRTCTLEFQSSELYCPCHGATFSATNGSVTRGPAQVTLGEYGVIVQNGGVYVSDSVIN